MRVVSLDVLRAVAILLVLGRHAPYIPSGADAFTQAVIDYWREIGWIGVDLFFVLSGFLVSGLLFHEYQRYGRLNMPRFLIRRGFKIYPPFYVFLLICVPLVVIRTPDGNLGMRIVAEACFLQNYLGGLWGHTWSLAVEEHFYLFLAATLWLLTCRSGADPFWHLNWLFGVVAVACLTFRVLRALSLPAGGVMASEMTHLRMDSLYFGVLLGYWHCFRGARLAALLERPALLLAGSAVLMLPSLLLERGHVFVQTFGLTLLYLAFGLVLLVGLHHALPRPLAARTVTGALATIGRYSYSIYLWHIPVRGAIRWGAKAFFPDDPPLLPVFVGYVLASLVVGIVIAHCLETPALRCRDRFFPSLLAARPRPASVRVPAEEALVRANPPDGCHHPIGSHPQRP